MLVRNVAAPGLLIALVASASLWPACSPSEQTGSAGPAAVGAGTGGAGTGGVGGSGASGSTGAGGGGLIIGNQDSGSTTAPPSDCGGLTLTPEQVTTTQDVQVTEREPVTFYFMQDQSGSMIEPSGLSTKWTDTTTAISQFVNDPASAGVYVAIQYFPLANAPCDGTVYNTPEAGPVQLNAGATTITNSLGAHGPFGGGTPIEGALRGVTDYCLNRYTPPAPGVRCIPVLITDGAPTDCDTTSATLTGIASAAYNNGAGVPTFVIGMNGADFTLLDAIATAGGTSCGTTPACNVSGGAQAFVDALNAIRNSVTKTVTKTVTQTTAVPCNWLIPPPPDGGTMDETLVNVDFTTGGVKTRLGYVASSNDCASASNAWYFERDASGAPTKIIACPSTCTTIQAASDAMVNVSVGCARKPAIIQ